MAVPAAPTNAVAAHIGQGAVVVAFDPPAGPVNYYEIFASENLAGPYVRYMNGIFTVPRGVLHNIPIGVIAYLQVRAVNDDGAGPFAQIYKGTVSKPTVLMNVTSIKGSRIPKGAIFAVPDTAGRIIAFSADEQVDIT